VVLPSYRVISHTPYPVPGIYVSSLSYAHCYPNLPRHYYPHYSKDKAMLQSVQHRFTRLFPELRVMTYEARLWSLRERRKRADLIEVYKLMHGYTDIPVSTYFQTATGSCTCGHTKKLVKSHCHTDGRLCFFSLRVINRWNSLSQETVDAPSVNAFKRHLESLRQKKMGYFMDSQSA